MSDRVLREDAEYVSQLVRKICMEVGPGCPGSVQENDRGMAFKHELECIVRSVEVEEFRCAPRAYLRWFRVGCGLGIGCIICLYLSLAYHPALLASIAFAISWFVVLILIFEFLLTAEFIDFAFKKTRSINVVGRLLPEGDVEPQRVIIFSGHHDSALQSTWLRYIKYGYYLGEGVLIITVLLLTASASVHFIGILASGVPPAWNVALFQFLSFSFFPASVVFGVFFTGSGKNGGNVPGATDNLSGCAIAVAIGRILKRHPDLLPGDTEVRIITFGSEEAGMRGSRRYVARHLGELKAKDAICFNIDTISDSYITIFTSDSNGLCKHSPEIVQKMTQAAHAAGVPHRAAPFPFGGGGTDAFPFSKSGIKAASINAMKVPAQMVAFYHQEWDTFDKLNLDGVLNVLKIAVEFIKALARESEVSKKHV